MFACVMWRPKLETLARMVSVLCVVPGRLLHVEVEVLVGQAQGWRGVGTQVHRTPDVVQVPSVRRKKDYIDTNADKYIYIYI